MFKTYQFKTHCKKTTIALKLQNHFARTRGKIKVNVLTFASEM